MIHSLTLHGFKSFSQRTHIEFEPGITAVIGPNGSGKSNVVEALRWVTHGARARELRAGRATELIFHGGSGAGRAPLGLAEVQAELRHSGETVHLGRRIYRDGTAEQELAGRGVRVRDIHAALRGTGLGPGGLAVIGQGEVSGVVQAEGSRLLGYLQEAAGLSRSVAAREETAARLAEAERHLSDLDLLQTERHSGLERLRRAAEAALRWRELSARQALLDAAQEREKQLALRRELAAAREEVARQEAASQELGAGLGDAAAQAEAAREALAQARAAARAREDALAALTAAEQAHTQAARYGEHLSSEASGLQAELANLPDQPPADAAPDLAELTRAVQDARARAEVAEGAARRLERTLTAGREAELRRTQAQARSEADRAALTREQERVAQALTVLAGETERMAAGLSQATAEREQQAAALAQAQAQAQTLQARHQEAAAERTRLQAGLAPLRRELERLEAALNAYSRYGEGARNALRLDHPGIVGSVADVLTVPAELETAVTAALGRRLEQVVVQTADDAKAIIAELKKQGGRATFLPLELLRERPRRDGALLREAGVVGNLADLCPTDPPLVGHSLLADTLIVDTLDTANRLARAHRQRPRLVTLGGEVVEPSGAMTGGRLRDSGSSVLADQRRFQELADEVDAAEEALLRAEAKLEALSAGEAADLPTLTAAHAAAQATERELTAQARELAARQRSLEADAARLAAQAAALPVPDDALALEGETADPAELEAELSAQRAGAEQARAAEREAAEALALGRELAALWQAYRQAEGRRAEVQARLSANAQAAAEQAAHIAAAAAEVERRRAALGDFDPGEVARAEAEQTRTADVYAALIAAQNKARARLDDLRLTIARREGGLGAIPDSCSPPGTPREWAHELGRLRAELEGLGPVNARAEADYQEGQAEWAATQAELDDAQAAVNELRGQLDELSDLEDAATRQALATVAAAFARYAAELLGGSGELEAQQDDAGRINGLSLAVQPGGKRTRSMTLLSAGERTMAGLAFLFALNHAGGEDTAGGLPLAVLDEVDAPLDEANIRRFTAFLTRFAAQGTQFILVTHQKATMEVADTLWGVTTDGGGVSRVLSIRQASEGAALVR
ncbi:Smc1/Cut3/Cut14 family protein [Deinococcus piscis]|uniref:Chromosome partition protein Smc n=1 Tax=Deinococcus piscis TaxID=394230 RepID=A0ABQ3K1D6_9DEIO|nr:chromosome segregation SMC family protein [Deinococcus piscis]GHF99312.1 Smc1/Cut3/Cut14 family protein [Deinococcus piscis]